MKSWLVLIALLFTTPAAASSIFVYRGAGCTGLERLGPFERLVGRRADGVVDFAETSSWQAMWNSINWNAGCWRGRGYRLAQSIPMLLDHGTSLEEGATGAYDKHFNKLGRMLVDQGAADAYLRVGWEFNGGWYPWSAARSPEAFKAYFRRIVRTLRAVPGQRFVIVWNAAQGEQQIAADRAYPGDDVVDVIALDLYNQSWRAQDRDPEIRWRNHVEQPYGLAWLASFAKARGKPIALPEWGTGLRPDGHGMGDDPRFVRNVAAWIRAHRVLFHGYWDYPASDFDAEISDGGQPLSADAYKDCFGAASKDEVDCLQRDGAR